MTTTKIKKLKKLKKLKKPRKLKTSLPKIIIKIKKENPNTWLGPNEKMILLSLVNTFGIPIALNYIGKLVDNYQKSSQEPSQESSQKSSENLISDKYGINKLKTITEVRLRCNELYRQYHSDRRNANTEIFIEVRKICEKKIESLK